MTTLHWQQLSDRQAAVQVQQAFYPPGYAFFPHDHDFAEIFLVLDGHGLHHGPGRRPQALQRGHLACIPPTLRHHLSATPQAPCSFLNIAFPSALLERALAPYPQMQALWQTSWPPHRHALSDHDLRAVLDWAAELDRPESNELGVHAFLLDLFRRLGRLRLVGGNTTQQNPTAAPAWLRETIDTAACPQWFAEGVRAYARLSGRGAAHINRLIRKHYGLTANQLCNQRRMDHAAMRLRHSGDTLSTIMQDCGFSAPAQFYRRFKERFGVAPATYREERSDRPL